MMLVYDESENVYIFKCSYEEKDICKEKGFRWDSNKRRWFTKLDDVAIKLKEYADEKTRIILEEKIKKLEEIKNLSSKIDLSEKFIKPESKDYRDYQKVGIKFMLTLENILNADDMGLGKTIQTIGVINNNENIKKVLIVCPKIVKSNWYNELKNWLVRDMSISIINGKGNNFDSDILIINYDLLQKHIEKLMEYKYDLLVLDEAHYIKNEKSIRSKMVFELKKNSKKKILLSGTPILNRPAEIYNLLRFLDNPLVKDKFYFLKRYANAYYRDVYVRGGNIRRILDVSGASNLEELGEKLRTSCMIRRKKEDVLKELPDKIKQLIEITAEGELKNLIERENKLLEELTNVKNLYELDDEMVDEVFNEILSKMRVGEKVSFTEMSSIRKEIGIQKVDYSIEFIEDVMENVDKAVVYFHHREVGEKLYENLKNYNPVLVLGGDNKSDEKINKFKSDSSCRLFLGSIKACGVGLNLTEANTVIFVETSWTPADVEQAIDRVYRMGQKNSVNVYFLVVNNSFDVYLYKVCNRKQVKVINKVMEI